MGHAVGRALVERGARGVTTLDGRCVATRERARRAGIEDLGSLQAAVEASDLVLSILPPAAALELARTAVPALGQAGHRVLYADCNAVSPATAGSMATLVADAGAEFIDVGIVGPPPGRGPDTRFYASGSAAERLRELDAPGVEVRVIGSEVGRASALKMVYAGLTKGTLTLYTAVLVAAEHEQGPRARVPHRAHRAPRGLGENAVARKDVVEAFFQQHVDRFSAQLCGVETVEPHGPPAPLCVADFSREDCPFRRIVILGRL